MDWNYILTSTVVSLLVSSTTFIFGLKAGKNQSDRPLMKELYRTIYSHFLKLFTDIDSTRPPKWTDYKKTSTHDGYKYVPLIEELHKEGKLIELDTHHTKELLELERKLLIVSSKQYSCYPEIESHIVSYLHSKIGDRLIKDSHSYSTSKNTQGKPFLSVSYSVFFTELIYEEKLKRLIDNNSLSIQLIYYTDTNKMHPIYLYVDDNGNNDEIIELFKSTYFEVKNLSCIKKIKSDKNQLLKMKDKTLKKLSRKSKNPHSFIETIFGAISDIFAS